MLKGRASIFSAIFAATCACIVLAIVGMGVPSFVRLEETLKRELLVGGQRQGDILASALQNTFHKLERQIAGVGERLARDKQISPVADSLADYQDFLKQWIGASEAFESAILLGPDAAVLAQYADDGACRPEVDGAIRDLIAKENAASVPRPQLVHRTGAGGRACLLILSRANLAGMALLGSIRLRQLERILVDVTFGTAALFSSNGDIILASPEQHGHTMAPRGVVTAHLQSGLADETKRYQIDANTSGVAVFGEVKDFAGLGYALALNEDVVFAPLRQLQRQYLLWGLLILLLGLPASYLVASLIAAPIRGLTQAALALQGGDFQIRVASTGLRETHGLASTFNTMAEKLLMLMEEQHHKGRMSAELETAKLVQQTIFPPALIESERYSVHALAWSATECRGDLWGLVPAGRGRVIVFVGDATGHGAPAALITVAVHAVCHALETQLSRGDRDAISLQEFASLLNRTVLNIGRGYMFMSMSMILVDPAEAAVTCINAGHPPPLHLQAPGESGAPAGGQITAVGDQLGIDEKTVWEEKRATFNSGDRLVLFTDGAYEGPGDGGSGRARRKFIQFCTSLGLRSVPEMKDGLKQQIEASWGSTGPEDDCTVIIVDLHGQQQAKCA